MTAANVDFILYPWDCWSELRTKMKANAAKATLHMNGVSERNRNEVECGLEIEVEVEDESSKRGI
jgi:hypothetical protein